MELDRNELLELVFDHMCEEQPEAVAELSDDAIRRLIKEGVGRAEQLGLDTEGSVTAYVSLLFVVGSRFDEQPAIRRILTDRSIPADDRIRKMMVDTSESDWEQAGGYTT